MEIDREVLGNLGVELLVVFGSRARQTAGNDSDLDVGVLFLPDAGHGYRELDEVRTALDNAGGPGPGLPERRQRPATAGGGT